jgi:uncharacterized repeat protein (TIGR03803 family)
VKTLRKNTIIVVVLTALCLAPCRALAQSADLGDTLVRETPIVTELYDFVYDGIGVSGYSHGKNLYSELIQGADGNFYGTTINGGSGGCADGFGTEGCGTIFRITPAGVQTVLFNFPYDSVTNTAVDGIYPTGGLVQGRDGNFYGTASAGGNASFGGNGCILGCGTIFKITPSGQFTLLHQFTGTGGVPAEGASPTGRMILGSDGKFYGTTNTGGAIRYGVGNMGTIFSITSNGGYATLHTFDTVDGLDGANPYDGLVQGKDGNFYGTTYFGGTDGVGTIFRATKAGVVTVLHSFVQPTHLDFPDGAYPLAALVQANDGNFYGATSVGGQSPGSYGAAFRITPQGAFTKLDDFDPSTGSYPEGGMIQASDGKLYGTTVNGGPSDCFCGSVYQLTLAGALTQLTSFEDATNGRWPLSVPLQAANGLLYVTTSRGPSLTVHDGGGAVVQIDNGLSNPKPAIARFNPTSGKVGASVTISGTNFIGTTKVSFNGKVATFTIRSTNTITTAVPSGATTGPIKVTNSGGTATSTGIFTVLP